MTTPEVNRKDERHSCSESCFAKHGPRTPEVKQWEEEFDFMLEYTDFSGDIGMFALVAKQEQYDTEDTARNRLKSFIRSLLQAREKEVLEKMRDMFAKEAETTPDHGGMNRGFRAAAMMVSASLASLQALNEK